MCLRFNSTSKQCMLVQKRDYMTLNFRFCEYLIACQCRNQNHHLVVHSLQTIAQWVPMQTISQKMSGQKIIGTQYSTIFILSSDHCRVFLKMVNLEAYDSKVYALCPIHHVCVDQQSKLQSHGVFRLHADLGHGPLKVHDQILGTPILCMESK